VLSRPVELGGQRPRRGHGGRCPRVGPGRQGRQDDLVVARAQTREVRVGRRYAPDLDPVPPRGVLGEPPRRHPEGGRPRPPVPQAQPPRRGVEKLVRRAQTPEARRGGPVEPTAERRPRRAERLVRPAAVVRAADRRGGGGTDSRTRPSVPWSTRALWRDHLSP
ncbi:hypothetical protein THAOC_05450, partial [Thalassiosira oceanica]